MNIIGIIVPKLVTLLAILIPSIDRSNKVALAIIWFIKLVVDYDAARPGHSGNIYKLTKGVGFEVGELIVSIIQFIPAVAFLSAAVIMRAWIPFIPGVIAVLICFSAVVGCIKDVIAEGKHLINYNKKNRADSMGIKDSDFLFYGKGIIDVTNLAAMSPEDSLGYMCGCTIIVASDGTIRVCEYEDENIILETIVAENIIRFSDNINNYDPSHITEVSLMTEDHDFRLSFETVKLKKHFVDTLKAL